MTKINVNPKIYKWLNQTTKPVVIPYGGSSAGKSYTLKQWLIIEKICKEQNKVFGFFRKFNTSLKDSLTLLFRQALIEYNIPFKENKTEQNFYVGSNLICMRGCDDPEKFKSTEFNYIWLEEATQFEEADYNRLEISLRRGSHDGKRNQMFITFNPVSIIHWLYKRLFAAKPHNVETQKVTYKDNPFLTQDDKDRLELNPDPLYRKIYCEGDWGIISEHNVIIPASLVYDAIKREPTATCLRGGLDIGVDVARFGDDKSVIYYKKGTKIMEPISFDSNSVTELARSVIGLIKENQMIYGPKLRVKVNVDLTTIGAGPVDTLIDWKNDNKMDNVRVNGVTFGANALDVDMYANNIIEMYENVKYTLNDPDFIMIDHEETTTELTSRTYFYDNKSRKAIEKKDMYKKRIGGSPDYADAFALMCYEPHSLSILDLY